LFFFEKKNQKTFVCFAPAQAGGYEVNMGVRAGEGRIILEGACGLEEAETLQELMEAHPDQPVDLAGAGHLHAAIAQILLARRPRMTGTQGDGFARFWLHQLSQPDQSVL
jgi:hypothetical protein